MRNNFKSIVLILTLVLSTCLAKSALADNTGWKVVERIQTNENATVANTYVRPVGLGGWGGTGCPDAIQAYIPSTSPGFEVIFNTMMASKLNGTPILFYGTCNAAGTYFRITSALLD